MTDKLHIGSLSAEPGTKTRGTVTADLGTLTVDIPLTLVNGAHPDLASSSPPVCTAASSRPSTPPRAWQACWNPARCMGR